MSSRRMLLGIIAASFTVAAAPAVGAPALTRLLLRAGEETGFVPNGKPQVSRTARAFLSVERGDKGYRADLRRLRAAGFRSGARLMMVAANGDPDPEGLSLVIELKSARVARKEAAAELAGAIRAQGKATIKRFTVPGVSGAKGFTATAPGRSGGAANAIFTEGHCVLLVGAAGLSGDLAAPVKAGVKAIHRRAHGRCP